MTIRSELARLKSKARALREQRVNVCTCTRLIIIQGEPTPEQQRDLDALEPCKLHANAVAVVEIGRAQPPLTVVQEVFELEN